MEGGPRSPLPEHSAPRLVEVVAAFSLATDLGLGQPMEHGLRSCLIATRLAERLDLDDGRSAAVYWVALLAMVGCTGDSHEMSEIFGDDIEFRRGMYDVGPSPFAMPRYFLARAGADGGPLRRARARAVAGADWHAAVMEGFVADCRITGRFAERLGFGETVSEPLRAEVRAVGRQGHPKRDRPERTSRSRHACSACPAAGGTSTGSAASTAHSP